MAKRSCQFWDLVASSGYRNVVSTNDPPTVFLHDGQVDEVRIIDGVRKYFIAESGLSDNQDEKARQILERLAALGDWAAGEIIGRRDRDDERLRSGYFNLKPRLSVPEMLVLRFIRRNPDSALTAISTPKNMNLAETGRIVDQLVRDGLVECSDNEKLLRVSDLEQNRYLVALAELTGSQPPES